MISSKKVKQVYAEISNKPEENWSYLVFWKINVFLSPYKGNSGPHQRLLFPSVTMGTERRDAPMDCVALGELLLRSPALVLGQELCFRQAGQFYSER